MNKTKKKFSDHECTFCGKTGVDYTSTDAGVEKHKVHKECVQLFSAWMRVGGSNEKPGDKEKSDRYNKLAPW